MKWWIIVAEVMIGAFLAGVILRNRRLSKQDGPVRDYSYLFLVGYVVRQLREHGLRAFKDVETLLFFVHFSLLVLLLGGAAVSTALRSLMR